MSKIYENEYGVFISHKKYIDDIYRELNHLELLPTLFQIASPYKSNKNNTERKAEFQEKYALLTKEQEEIKKLFSKFLNDFQITKPDHSQEPDQDILKIVDLVYEKSGKSLVRDVHGANIGPPVIKKINNSNVIFPQNSIFFSKDIADIHKYIHDSKYDLILLDPPWWNKYIRRKRKKSNDAYNMLFNEDIKSIPIGSLLKDTGMVVVWCTNSPNHLKDLLKDIFPKWGVQFCCKWYWLKVTTSGKPVCNFSVPPGKQPYEKIIFGYKKHPANPPVNGKLIISVPSALHSHKPPLVELLKDFLPKDPSCLEIFARYLLPGWTSYGNEVLRLQHESLFTTT